MNYSKLKVPIQNIATDNFIKQNNENYKNCLEDVRGRIESALKGSPVHKIYGREDKQGGEPIKDTQKITYKFNTYYQKKRSEFGSLWEIPDIVGFTVVVAYPSQISDITKVIDYLIDHKDLMISEGFAFKAVPKKDHDISTKYGRILTERGYYACHYNLRSKGFDTNTPICEVQIKTVLHDAWGAKTHDLTYKNSTNVDPSLVQGFELLGDTLAKIDQQSDLIRKSLENSIRVRNDKQEAINQYIHVKILESATPPDSGLHAIKDNLMEVDPLTDSATIDHLENVILEHARSDNHREALIAQHFLATRSKDRFVRARMESGLVQWENTIVSDYEKTQKIALIALMHFYSGYKIYAIEETERAVRIFDSLTPVLADVEHKRFWVRGNSIKISLSYYYAERIGSHEGKLANAKINAKKYLKASVAARSNLPSCPNNVFVEQHKIQEAITDPFWGDANFDCLDCETFIRIQLSTSVSEVKKLRGILQQIHQSPPSNKIDEAGLLYEFHDYCARQKLSELE